MTTHNVDDYPHEMSYFLAGDGYFIRLKRLAQWLVDAEIDCLIFQGKPDMEKYGRDVNFLFRRRTDLVAFRLAHDYTIL